jgi:23S rRNA (guanosine2251-2'-O)-methyltransferase
MKRTIILFGIHPILEAIEAGRRLRQLYVATGRRDARTEDLISAAKRKGASIHYESRDRLDEWAKTEKHQGVVAMVEPRGPVQLETLIDQMKGSRDKPWPPLVVMLDEIEDPNNLGAVIRTAEAAGADGLVIPSRRSAGVTPAVEKASAGAVSHLPVVQVANLRQAMDSLKKGGLWIYGLDAGAGTIYWDVDGKVPVTLVAGAEGKGLRPLVREQCDQLISLPMRGRVASLNVSVSVGIVLYDIVRQRTVL